MHYAPMLQFLYTVRRVNVEARLIYFDASR